VTLVTGVRFDAGPLALLGSGEFLSGAEALDRSLLAGRPPRVVHLATAAAPDGHERLEYWHELGRRHFERIGAEMVPLPVRNRVDAESGNLAAKVMGAGLIYLSGGNPGYLADTLRGTAVLAAILEAWRAGAAVAGCSAGAMALTTTADDVTGRRVRPGLAVLRRLALICHFGRTEECWPGTQARRLADLQPGQVLVGLEDETAIVGGPDRWQVHGRGRAWRLVAGSWVPSPAGSVFATRTRSMVLGS
jgi:cyanophycinase